MRRQEVAGLLRDIEAPFYSKGEHPSDIIDCIFLQYILIIEIFQF